MSVTNPKTVSFVDPTTALEANGTSVAWSAATDLASVNVAFDGVTAPVNVPVAAGATSVDLTALPAYTALAAGTHTVQVAVVTKEGIVGEYSSAVSFLVGVTPVAPTGVVVA